MITVFNTKQSFNYLKDANDIREARFNLCKIVNRIEIELGSVQETIGVSPVMLGKAFNCYREIGQVQSSLLNAMTMSINLKRQTLLTDWADEAEQKMLDFEIERINIQRNLIEGMQIELQQAEGRLTTQIGQWQDLANVSN